MSITDKQLMTVEFQDGWFNDIYHRMDKIMELRLVEKISRPIHISIKQKFIDQYTRQIQQLHHRINQLKKQVTNDHLLSKNHLRTNSTTKCIIKYNKKQFVKNIQQIQAKYYDTFFNGSIRHYSKLATIFGFKQNIKFINIEEWSQSCKLKTQVSDDDCCC